MKKKKVRKKNNPIYREKDWALSQGVIVTPDRKMRDLSTSIRLPYKMVQKLKKIARQKGGIGYQTLMKIWIAEKLDKESA
jgi:hypothetical protein